MRLSKNKVPSKLSSKSSELRERALDRRVSVRALGRHATNFTRYVA